MLCKQEKSDILACAAKPKFKIAKFYANVFVGGLVIINLNIKDAQIILNKSQSVLVFPRTKKDLNLNYT